MRISTTTYGDAKRHAEVWHDSVGNLLSRTDARTITTCFGSLAGSTYSGSPYDASNRPTSVSYSDGTPTVTYAYDGVPNGTGQLTSITNGNSTTNYTSFDALGRVTASNQQIGGKTYNFAYGYNLAVNSTYDAAGNLMVFGSMNVSYDAENRQIVAGATSYFYDGAGQRVKKTGPNGTTVYVYDAFGQLAAEYASGPATGSPCANTCYLSYDLLGSVRLVTDGQHNVVARHDYAPFGQEIPAGVGGRTNFWAASDNINQKFTGQERDGETNLDFFQARYMSSGLGRFMSADPGNAGADFTNPQSWNGYAYVLGNPLGLVDPSGMTSGSPCENNFSCMSGIPGCLQNVNLCAQQYFAPDIIQGLDPFRLIGLQSYTPPFQQTSLGGGWQSSATFNGITTTFPAHLDNASFFAASSAIASSFPIASWSGQNLLQGYKSALTLLSDFLTGTGQTNRNYTSFSPESMDLERSGGFQRALRSACASGQPHGGFNVSTPRAAVNIPHDVMFSATGGQVGGYVGTFDRPSPDFMNITIRNDASANSFFYHVTPNRASPSGPLRTIKQRFSINVGNPCGD